MTMATKEIEYILKKNTSNRPTMIAVTQTSPGWDVYHRPDGNVDGQKLIGHIDPRPDGHVMLKTGEIFNDIETAVDKIVEQNFDER